MITLHGRPTLLSNLSLDIVDVRSAQDSILNPPRLATMEKRNAILYALTKSNLFWHSGFTNVDFNVRGKRGYRSKGPVITCALCRRLFRSGRASTMGTCTGDEAGSYLVDEAAWRKAECKIQVSS